jgi:hypothetical protein
MPFLTSIINWLNVKRVHQLDLTRKYPVEMQQETFMKLITRAADTEWGRKYQYNSITSWEEYQQRVPIQTYEEVKSYVTRLRKGEQNLLWPGDIRWFAKSSGTTSDKSKFIPVSKESLEECHFRGGRDVLTIYCQNNPETRIFSGKGLTLGGSHKIDNYSSQSYYGDLSAILIENLPFWTEFIRTPSHEVALMEKFEEKLERLARETVEENVTNIAGVPSWNLVMLKYILQHTGKKNILEVWPNLELFIHGGVSFIPYREQFRNLIPSEGMHYLEAYNASEGFFAIQDDPAQQDMLLMLDYGIFFEFIPLEQLDHKEPRALTLAEVETDKNYAIVISTNSGLWRYMIGDTVRFTSTFPHKIVISGRTRHFINVFGEEVIVDNADKAIRIACDKTAAEITDYTAAPVFMSSNTQGAHEWLLEFTIPPADLDYFATLLDHALMAINSDYEAKRYRNLTLNKPIVHQAETGTFYRWLQERGKLGGQNKVPRLSNERKYLEELLELNTVVRTTKK